MRQRVLLGLSVWVAAALFFAWFARRAPLEDAVEELAGVDAGPEPGSPAHEALAVSDGERRIAETLAEAQRVELGDAQLQEFEDALRLVRASPLQGRTWERVKRYERTLPLFLATEKALFACLKGLDRDPRACVPSPAFRSVLDSSVASGDLAREEADKYLELLASMKDPATRPPMPPGGVAFMERESAMKARNMERIAAAVRRVEAESPPPPAPAPALRVNEPPAPR